MDPLAEKKYFQSGYVYAHNNPLLYLDPDGLDDIYYDSRGNEVQRITNDTLDRLYLVNRTDHNTWEVVSQLEQAPVKESPILATLGLASATVIPIGASSMSANAAITSYIAELASVGAPTVVIVATLLLIASENRKYHLACMPGTAMEPCSPWDYNPVLDDTRLYASQYDEDDRVGDLIPGRLKKVKDYPSQLENNSWGEILEKAKKGDKGAKKLKKLVQESKRLQEKTKSKGK